MNSQLGYQPSYAWRSIQRAKSLLEEGLIWRIGNGKTVSIWQDKWIPQTWTYRIHSPPTTRHSSAKVEQLIDVGSGRWDPALVKAIFIAMKANAVLQSPLGMLQSENKLIWQYTQSGSFSVKSVSHNKRES